MSTRVVVPDVLDVEALPDGRGLVHLGRLAHIPEAEPASIAVWVVPRARAAATSVRVGAAHPHVSGRLEACRWRVVTPGEAAELEDAGMSTLRLGPGLSARWALDGTVREVRMDPDTLRGAWPAAWPGEDEPERRFERVVRALTRGKVTLRDVALAQWADALESELLDHEESLLTEYRVHASVHSDAAHELAAVLQRSEGPVEIPLFDRASPVDLPGVELATEAGVLELTAETRWVVDEVEDWEPPAAQAYRRARMEKVQGRLQAARAEGKRRERRVWITIGLLLALGLAVGLLGWWAS